MIRGIGSSRAAMAMEQARTDVIANNIANINTDGFKRSVAVGTELAPIVLRRFDELVADGQEAPSIGTLGNGSVLDQVVLGRTVGQGGPAAQPGTVEHSNVDLAQEMTDLITALRSFQVNQRALQMQDGTLGKAVNELANS